MVAVGERTHSFLSFAKFRFTLRVNSPMVLPPYKGAVFRGAFGNSFKRLVCIAPKADCSLCSLRENCLYVSIFEAHPPQDCLDAGKFSQAPRPYVLNPPLTSRQSFRPGEELAFELVLIGPAIKAFPYFLQIVMDMGRLGLGRRRGQYEVLSVDQIRDRTRSTVYRSGRSILNAFEPEEGPDNCLEDELRSLTLNFLTPLRLKERGNLLTRLTFSLLFRSLAQRLTLLAGFYGLGTKIPFFTPIVDSADAVTTTAHHLHWYDWERYSRRQDDTMKFGGLKGKITFSGQLGPFLPFLRLGETINLGQATSFGLGKYCLLRN